MAFVTEQCTKTSSKKQIYWKYADNTTVEPRLYNVVIDPEPSLIFKATSSYNYC